jgi:UDP-N-acetylmuramoylalanine--D-glutamate ligase
MDDKYNNLGIWGYGKVGQSVAHFFKDRCSHMTVMDTRKPDNLFHASWVSQDADHMSSFFQSHDVIIASPGVDLQPYYHSYRSKIMCELDIFHKYWKKPLISITGTVGKTSLVTLFHSVLSHYGHHACMAGNIGVPCLDIIDQQDVYDCALIEASSFQLEYTQSYAPDIAVISNLYPNHLDRHKTIESYIQAKYQIIAHQEPHQKALIPLKLKETIEHYYPRSHISYTCNTPLSNSDKRILKTTDIVYVNNKDGIYVYTDKTYTELITWDRLPHVSYHENWLIIVALCHMYGLDIHKLAELHKDTLSLPEHRLELVPLNHSLMCFNDSKSTIMDSTLHAVKKIYADYPNKKIQLCIGGLSKGVDRSVYIKQLTPYIDHLYICGAEKNELCRMAREYGIAYYATETLDELCQIYAQNWSSSDVFLFSPGGSSFDLFNNYIQRGQAFKDYIQKYMKED